MTHNSIPYDTYYEQDLALALEHDLFTDEAAQAFTEEGYTLPWEIPSPTVASQYRASAQHRPHIELGGASGDWDISGFELENRLAQAISRASRVHTSFDDDHAAFNTTTLDHSLHRIMNGAVKHARESFEGGHDKRVTEALEKKAAVAVISYEGRIPNPEANDVWPDCRSPIKLPSLYSVIDWSKFYGASKSTKQPSGKSRNPAANAQAPNQNMDRMPGDYGRPEWRLPVELVELIAGYLNRDDIKALRLVSRELDFFVSQVMFRNVVVPFNTEIYGMLGQLPKIDFKGKKRAKLEKSGYFWKNSNVDDIYNGHGLDVFRGFGRHIMKFGMSFEVDEASLANPPSKTLTEKKTAFWGNYDWPYEEYRRFEAVAGLETAADETPRMKIAFSELSKVKELALSVDSGLGWLNGPDRSIRGRIFQRPWPVFGSSKDIPDRRAQAQQDLWDLIEACHQKAGSDVRLATLYKMEGIHPVSELQEVNIPAYKQPSLPYLDPLLISKATPYDAADISVPSSFEDPEDLQRFIQLPGSSGSGVLFSSTIPPADAGQLMCPIIPANLTTAQKEWLLETEWAQRAFMSSYMLSIIDNPITFNPVHTLNISKLSDRYLSMLNRSDFWDSLPNLANVTLMVDPGWRSVHKDEAGFVHTPRIKPTQGIESFVSLLRDHVATRPNIRSLTVGWVVGGEHAEGLHARNKLIMPAPLIGPSVGAQGSLIPASEMAVENDVNRVRASMLRFPYLERLTLKNCWITPPALIHFVKIHDSYSLNHLVLDSLSLTAILQPGVPHQAAPPPPAQPAQPAPPALLPVAAPPAVTPAWNHFNNGGGPTILQGPPPGVANQQLLQIHIQSLHVQQQQLQQLQQNATTTPQQQHQLTVLQGQIQSLIQQLHLQLAPVAHGSVHHLGHVNWQHNPPQLPQLHHNMINITNLVTQMQQNIANNQPAPVLPTIDLQYALRAQPRAGSWVNIIDIISPGNNLNDFGSEHSQADKERTTTLETIEFISCGYAKLPQITYDQSVLDRDNGVDLVPNATVFAKRHAVLIPAMLNVQWSYYGEIVQGINATELTALDAGWNLKTGWEDEEAAKAVEFDGLMSGGTGRFSGVVRQSDKLVDSTSSDC